MKFGALVGYIFDNPIKLTVHNPRKKYEVFYPENDLDGIMQYNNYDVLGIYCCGEYLSIEIAHNNYVNGGQLLCTHTEVVNGLDCKSIVREFKSHCVLIKQMEKEI